MSFEILNAKALLRPVTGMDTAIIASPRKAYEIVDGRIEPTERVHQDVFTLSFDFARNLGETLHHASWTMTVDPEVLRRSLLHDCEMCRQGVEAGLAHLETRPGQPLLVGILFWAGRA